MDGTVFRIRENVFTFDSFPFPEICPVAGLVQGSNRNFYGTASSGGASNVGTVFEITPTGGLTFLVSFIGANGAYPTSITMRR